MKALTITQKDKVIFRKFNDGGDIIALFPLEPWDVQGFHCSSYQHQGQHGGADTGIIRSGTRPAKPEEYASLKKELESIGYNLEVIQRVPVNAYKVRCAILNSI